MARQYHGNGNGIRRPQPSLRPVTGNGVRRPRIALYSHDTQGLGHIRRNILISRALCNGGETPVILLLSGLREAAAFAMPNGVDCVTLPSLGKGVDGQYFPRSLALPMADLIDVRSRAITAVLRSFDPDVMIVDKAPRGIFDELKPGLELLRSRDRHIVLGLREILDSPDAVRQEWTDGKYEAAIRAYYDQIWIYGDRDVYDTVSEYDFAPDIAARTRYTGYLNPLDSDEDRPAGGPDPLAGLRHDDGPLDLCVVGGGRDGVPLAEAFLQCRLPGAGVLVTGPLMPAENRQRLQKLAADRPSVRVLEFVTDPCPLFERADRVIAMGGYNTICEIMAFRKKALIVPRVEPRTEQLIRAECFSRRGLLDMLHPDDLSPSALSSWIASTDGQPSVAQPAIDLGGVARLPALLDDILGVHRPETEPIHAAS
jgi:predicted glycosyltransferase